MTNDQSDAEGSDAGLATSRRTFVGLAGASVLGGAAVLAASSDAHAQSLAPGRGVQGSTEVKRPATLGPRGMMDNRYPATFAESVPKGVEVLMGYFTAFTQRDLKGMAEYLHFPFASFEGTDPVLVNTPDDLMRKPPASMNMNLNPQRFSDNDGYMKAGCYDVFRGLEVLCMDPVIATMSMSYDRYGSDGKKLLRCEGVYSVTNNDGRWGIELMSTIFTPAEMIGVEFADAIMAAKRFRVNLDLAYQTSNVKENPANQVGSNASIEMAKLPYTQSPLGDYKTMERFQIKGVKSRLQFNPPDSPRNPLAGRDMKAFYADYRESFAKSGIGNWGFVYGNNHDTRVLHHTFNKVHILTGAVRFLAAGEECNSDYDVEVVTYKEGYWGNAGYLCYTTPHDRSNDILKA